MCSMLSSAMGESDTVDELGIGVVRDALADRSRASRRFKPGRGTFSEGFDEGGPRENW